MHGFALGAAGFVDDALEEAANSGVGERAGVDALGIFQDFALAFGLIERKILNSLEFADFEGAAGTLVEQLDEFAIDFIDLATPVGESHGATSRRERPWVAACLSDRTRAAMGSCVTARARRMSAGRSSGSTSLAPVTPVRLIR